MTQNVYMDYTGLMILSLLKISFPREEKAPIHSPWYLEAALELEWAESLKPMAKMRLEHICYKFSVLPPLSSSSLELSN